MWYNILIIQNIKKGEKKMSWEIIKHPNPENDMFRLYELYDEKIDKIEYTEAELEVIEQLLIKSGDR